MPVGHRACDRNHFLQVLLCFQGNDNDILFYFIFQGSAFQYLVHHLVDGLTFETNRLFPRRS